MWHCPHCGAPQAETARCWVCRRSSTTCSTCRHFRRALAGDLGFCALDRRRLPLTGRELRGCWEENPETAEAAPSIAGARVAGAAGPSAPEPVPIAVQRLRREGRVIHHGAQWQPDPDRLPARDFVPVEDLRAPMRARRGRQKAETSADASNAPAAPERQQTPFVVPEPDANWSERTNLFGDAEA